MGGIYPRSNKFVSELLYVLFIEKSVSSFSVVNKIGSTTVRLQCGEGDATLISQQLSHSIHTQARHYEVIVGSVHAANAFRTKEALRGRRMNKKAVSCTRVNRYQKMNSYRREKSERNLLQKRKKRCGYFATKLAAKTTTTLFSWQEFLRDHPYTIGTRNKSRTRSRTWLSSHKLS